MSIVTGPDAAYSYTRRRGKQGSIFRLTATDADPQTGERTETEVETVVRWMVKEVTQYSRMLRAEATQQRVGDVTFVVWLQDVQAVFTSLQTEDYIIFNSVKYNVVSSWIEDTSFVITCIEFGKA